MSKEPYIPETEETKKAKKIKYKFEGIKTEEFEDGEKLRKGKTYYAVLEIKTGKILHWDKKTYEKHEDEVER